MQLANCRSCGKIFQKVNRNLCPQCLADEDALFRKVRDFLEKNPGLTVAEVARACKVDQKRIYDFLKEGRLEGKHFSVDSVKWACESCGQEITHGKLCNRCRSRLNSEIRGHVAPKFEAEEPQEKKASGKIHLSRWQDRK